MGISGGFVVVSSMAFFHGGISQENRELEEMKAELLKRSHELVETQRSLRKLQEALPAPEFPEFCWRFWMEALEEKNTENV